MKLPVFPFKTWRKQHPWLTGVLVAAASGVAIIGAARIWITTDSGRNFIVSQLNGLEIAGYGQLSIQELRGDPLSDLQIGRIQIANENGVWAEVQDVRMRWSPLAILSKTIDIAELDIDNATVLSRPSREPRPSSDGGGNWKVNLNSLVLDKLVLADGVAGGASTSEISARFVQQGNGALDAALRLRPIEGRGDRVDLLIVMTASRRFDITVIADAPADGIFAHMLELEPGSAARLEANGAGDLRNGVGEARLSIDRENRAYFSGKIEEGLLTASAKVDATALPLPDEIVSFLGASAETALSATIDDNEAHFEFDALVAEGEVHLAGLADLDARELIGPAHLRADMASLQPFWEKGAGVWLNGELTYAQGTAGYSGDVRIVAEEETILPFEAAAGRVSVSFNDGSIPFSGNLELQGPFRVGDVASSALGPTPTADVNGRFDISSGILLLDAAELTHKTGSFRLAGQVNTKEPQLSLAGRVNQSIAPFVPGLSGGAEGILSIEGPPSSFDISTNLSLRNLSGPAATTPLVNGDGTAAATISVSGGEVVARMMRLRLAGLNADISGSLAGEPGLNLSVIAEQSVDLNINGTIINAGALQGTVSRTGEDTLIVAKSEGGRMEYGAHAVRDLTISTSLTQDGTNVDGPVRMTGLYEQERIDLSAILQRRDGATRIDDLAGFLGKLKVSGYADIGDNGELDLASRVSGSDFILGGARVGQIAIDAFAQKTPDQPISISLEADARNAVLGSDLGFERIRTNVLTTDQGYQFSAQLNDTTRGRETDMQLSGSASLSEETPAGTLAMRGLILGHRVATRRDATWRFGETPEIDAEVEILDGVVKAALSSTGRQPELHLELDDVDAGPLLASQGLPVSAARIDGSGVFQPYGVTPTGTFEIRTNSPVSGLDGAIELDVNGKLNARMFSVNGTAKYGPTLGGNFALAIPVSVQADDFVRPDMQGALLGNASINGDLEAIRQIALAYGHDIDGTIDATVRLAGTLGTPQIDAKADIANGLYEYGAMGFRIAHFDMGAAYDSGAIAINATGQGPDGGNLKASGRIDATGEGQVDLELKRLLVFDRNSDNMRLTGNAALKETAEARIISGRLNVDEANFSLDNLPAASARRLDVRWREDISDEPVDPVLEKPIRFDFQILSDRRIFIDGRGLDSEWGVNVNVTGSPSAPLLNGRATLVRGELELARRPFVFDSGIVTFDGPIESARVAISAARQVDGFSARVDLTGSPTNPRIELSSTPDLPQDEILARMLFGRSMMDLSALEAAELASSIARLSGQGSGIDPLGQIQAGLGLDRLRLGMNNDGTTELGVGQYLASDVYLEVTTAGAAGNSVEVEWQPRPQISVTSEASSTGESRVSIRWKRDY